ncbi:MAG: hypothetical protein ACRDP3_17605 [Streptomyces sp.]|uniref:hypothetical protein n=1 Tax=Streptomyces sp. TaxID=1931 RepID=UPI003D6B95B8
MFSAGSGSDAATVGWWIAAAIAAVAFGAVMQTWVTKRSWKFYLAIVPALGSCLAVFAGTAQRGEGARTALQLYTVLMLAILVTMALFTRYIRSQLALIRSGRTAQTTTQRQAWTFLLTFFVVAIAIGAGLDTLLPG